MSGDPLFARVATALANRYVVERELGHGGMATVYLARDVALGRAVAIKVLPPTTREHLGGERFTRETQIAAQLSHPHIVPLFEAGEAEGILFYVMGYVEGESLLDRLAREGALPLEESVRLIAEVADAPAYAHEHGVIHRDIKHANVLLAGGHALVADFGIAKPFGEAAGGGGGESVTGTGVAVGTAEYMSPEQATGDKHLDARSDVYALAALLYEMLTSEPPFTGPTVQAVIARILTEAPRPIRTIRPGVPPHVEAAVLQGLAKVAADRPPSARAFVDLLTRPTAERPVRPGRRRAWIVLGTLAAVAVPVAAAVLYFAGRHARPVGMLLVPAGDYLVGGTAGRDTGRVHLNAFYIDSTEVTAGAYAPFVRSGGAPSPYQRQRATDWPVTGVLWAEAQKFCAWRLPGGRLPTEDEWEAAARGSGGRRYPWGDTWAPSRANVAGATDTLAPVGSFPLGASWVHAVDLIGNAWEWTATAAPGIRGQGLRHVIKGGAFSTRQPNATAAYRVPAADDRAQLWNTGFRCARTVR